MELLSRGILFAIISFIAGVGVESFFPDVSFFSGILLLMAGVIVWGISGKYKVLFFGGISVLFFWVGTGMANRAMTDSDVSDLRGQTITGKGVVMEDASINGFSQRITVRIDSEVGQGEWVAVSTDRWEKIFFGDTIRFSCAFARPENFSPDFDFRMYLASKKIYAVCENARVEVLTEEKTFWGYLGKVRRLLEESVNRSIEQPYASLGNGLLFGGSGRMSDELSQDFSQTSMTHIVAVSGYNVSLIAGYVFILAIYFGLYRKWATVVSVGGIILFVLFIGSPSSAIRAGVMGGILLFTLILGRSNVSFRALLYAGAIMILLNPLIVRYDVGFQLSFLATLGIVSFSPWYEKIRPKTLLKQTVADILYMTTSAQLWVLPVIIGTFHSFSWVSVATNLSVLWTLPFAMLFTFLSSVFGLISPWFGFVFGMPAQLVLWYDIFMVQWFATMSWSILTVAQETFWFVFFWYGCLGGIVGWMCWRERKERRALCKKS